MTTKESAAEQFAQRAVAAANDVALALAGENDARVLAALCGMRSRLRVRLSALLGPKLGAETAESFIKAVLARRADIETATRSRVAQ